MLRATDLHHRYGDCITLDGVGFHVALGDRIALTGRNGAGKTTLLRVVLGQLKADSGLLEFEPDLRIGNLQQDPVFEAGQSVLDVMQAALWHVRSLELRLRELECLLEDQGALETYNQTLEAFERAGGYRAEARALRMLAALQLSEFLEREAASLSGGERTRLALALALVDQPDLLVLDEPTNHLDIRMRLWLENTLREYPGALLIVSHDRALLDAVVKQTWHLEHGRFSVFKGGYTRARAQRFELRRVQARQSRLGQFETQRLERSASEVARWGRNNDKLARRAKAIAARAERLRELVVEAPMRERQIRMALEAGNARAKMVLRAEHLSKHFAKRPILLDASLRLRVGDRVALLAPNGAGKTTFLNLLLGKLAPDTITKRSATGEAHALGNRVGLNSAALNPASFEAGPETRPEIRYADGVQVAAFDQLYHGLEPNRTVFSQLLERVGEGSARALLGRHGFRSEDGHKHPTQLSGGERARAGLALIAATRADLLILDEPTNHLDVEAIEALEQAILAYQGCVLFVTHDRRFAQAIATRVLSIVDGKLIEFEQGFAGFERLQRGQVETLDPGRVLSDELVLPEPGLNADQQLQICEERLFELEELFLQGGLSQREHLRLKREQQHFQDRAFELLGEKFAAPQIADHALRLGGFQVLTEAVGSGWRFWVDGAEDCPMLAGVIETKNHALILRLGWVVQNGQSGSMLAWFRKLLLRGATNLAFEHLDVSRVELPLDEPLDHAIALEVDAHARALGLLRLGADPGLPEAIGLKSKRWRFHPSFEDWARWRAWRRERHRANSGH